MPQGVELSTWKVAEIRRRLREGFTLGQVAFLTKRSVSTVCKVKEMGKAKFIPGFIKRGRQAATIFDKERAKQKKEAGAEAAKAARRAAREARKLAPKPRRRKLAVVEEHHECVFVVEEFLPVMKEEDEEEEID